MTIIFDLTYLNTACFLSLNTDDRKYKPHVIMAQKDLREILGAEFYAQIESQYPSYSGDNLTLYNNYIKDFLAWQTYAYYLGMSQADSTPTGERSFNDENSALLADVQLYSREKNVKNYAKRFRDDIINYLRITQSNDSTKFPLWTDTCKTEYSFGITAIDKKSDGLVKVNKAIITND